MLAAIVLAAGDSTRMGAPKALLTVPGGATFIDAIVRTLDAASLDDIVVVTGRIHDLIVDAVGSDLRSRVRFVRNPDPSRGQLSSLWVGMDAAVTPGTEALVVTLVDVPLVTPPIVRRVIAAWRTTGAPIVRPAIGDKHGHPVVFDRAVFDELRAAPLSEGAKSVLRRRAHDILDVTVDDDRCLVDVDTPSDYTALRQQPRDV